VIIHSERKIDHFNSIIKMEIIIKMAWSYTYILQ